MIMPRLVQSVGDGYAFPLGIAYVTSSLKAAGFDVLTLNLNHKEGTVYEVLEEYLSENSVDVVCTGGLSFQYPTIRDIVETIKTINPRIILIVGGGLITAEPKVAMEALAHADYGVIGEGERILCRLARVLEDDAEPRIVKGIVYRDGNQYQCTENDREIQELDALPWPDYEGFELSKYLELPSVSVNNIIAKRMLFVCGSRSCPYNCTFCFHSTGRKYRQRSIDAVLDEISWLHEHYHLRLVTMSDELFARDRVRIQRFATKMKEMDLPWTGSFRVDDVDEEVLEILKQGKCASMSFGLESADDRILKSMRKHITVSQIEYALKLTSEAGIPSAGNFIFGDIAETLETARNTLKWWAEHVEYNIGLNLVAAYPGSYIYDYACAQNIITDKIQFLKDGCPVVNISKMSNEEMGLVVKDIFDAPYRYGKQVESVSVYEVKADGRLTIVGRCCKCGAINIWENVKLFVGNCWLPCVQCKQKHNVPLLPSLQNHLTGKIHELLHLHGSVAFWGVTYYSLFLFEHMPVFSNGDIAIVDNSAPKQMATIGGKPVQDPAILGNGRYSCVVVFYPNSYQQIQSQITRLYPKVANIIDICELVEGVKMETGDHD